MMVRILNIIPTKLLYVIVSDGHLEFCSGNFPQWVRREELFFYFVRCGQPDLSVRQCPVTYKYVESVRRTGVFLVIVVLI